MKLKHTSHEHILCQCKLHTCRVRLKTDIFASAKALEGHSHVRLTFVHMFSKRVCVCVGDKGEKHKHIENGARVNVLSQQAAKFAFLYSFQLVFCCLSTQNDTRQHLALCRRERHPSNEKMCGRKKNRSQLKTKPMLSVWEMQYPPKWMVVVLMLRAQNN